MQVGVIGLGRVGADIALRIMGAGHTCVVFDIRAGAVETLVEAGATGASGLPGLVRRLSPPRTVWVMLPAGQATEDTVAALSSELGMGDCIIDGGNSFYKDDIRRARALREKGWSISTLERRGASADWSADTA